MPSHPLDNAIWHALTSVQHRFAEGSGSARRYSPAVAPFAGTLDLKPASLDALKALLAPNETVALFSPEPIEPPASLLAVRRATVEQMILTDTVVPRSRPGPAPSALGIGDLPDMLALADRTKPGPFGPRVIELGSYVGLRRAGVLVGMSGERMRLPGFTEISAVCVDADARGLGLAAALVTAVVDAISMRSDVPFLHVFSSNAAAIQLYRKVGFVIRRQMHLVVLARADARGF